MQSDNLLHLMASYIISSLVFKYTRSKRLAFLVSITIGIVKEIYDAEIKKTYFSWSDIFYDLIGTLLGLLL